MQVITLSRVKALLGISETTYDTDLQLAIPIVDAAVKQITGNRYNYRVSGSTVVDSASVSLLSVIGPKYFTSAGYVSPVDTLDEFVQVGQLISGTGIPADTYIEEVFYNYPEGAVISESGVLTVTMSADATATGDSIAVYLGIPISYQPIIAKAVWWQKEQFSMTVKDEAWSSKSMGPVSVTKAGGSEKLDGKTGMPLWFVRAFPKYHGGH